jgi:hypothetical protein
MGDTPSKWKRDILIIPLIIGLLVAVFTFLLPKLLDKGKELSYTIDGPTSYVNQQAVGNITITVNGVATSNLFAYKIRLWNTGGTALRDMAVRFSFSPKRQDFQIFNVSHETNPRFEFGKIEEAGSDATSKRFVYELLNAGDEDTVTLLVNDDAPLSLYAKAEGMKLTQVTQKVQTKWSYLVAGLVGPLGAIIISILSLGLKYFSSKRGS